MPGPSPGGSQEKEAAAGGRWQGPGRGRRVRFRLPHTSIALPSVCDEERLFYRRLEAVAAPGPGGFGPLFAADGWSDLTEDRLLRKRVLRDGQGGPRPRPGQEVSVKVLGALEDGRLVERDPRLSFVPGHGDVVQVSPGRGAGSAEHPPVPRPASPAVPVSAGPGAGRPHHAARGGLLLPRRLPLRLRPPGQGARRAARGAAAVRGDAVGGAGRPRPAAAAPRRPPAPGRAAEGTGQLPLRAGRLPGSAALLRPGPTRPRRPRRGPARAAGGRGAAGAARQVPQQLRGRRAEAAAGRRGAGGLRSGSAHQPRQRPGAAPPGAAAGAAGPGRGGRAGPEESPGAGPGQQGDPRRALAAGEAPEPSGPHRSPGAPPRPDAAAEPRSPSTARGGRSGLSGAAAPRSPPGGAAPAGMEERPRGRPWPGPGAATAPDVGSRRREGASAAALRSAPPGPGVRSCSPASHRPPHGSCGHAPFWRVTMRREPARTGAAEEPEEAERLGQGQAAGRRALGRRPQAEGLGDHAAEAEESRREEGGRQVARGRAGPPPPRGRAARRQDAQRSPGVGPPCRGPRQRPASFSGPSPIKVACGALQAPSPPSVRPGGGAGWGCMGSGRGHRRRAPPLPPPGGSVHGRVPWW